MDKVKLKDICDKYYWIMPATPKYVVNGEMRYITSKNIKDGNIQFDNCKNITKESYLKISKDREILENDILISMIGTLGEMAIVKKEDLSFYGQNMFLLRLNQQIINLKYFYYYFTSPNTNQKLISRQNNSTQGYLKANHITELEIPLPTLAEQEAIVKKLDSIEKLIFARKTELDELDLLIKAKFNEMFGYTKLPYTKSDFTLIKDIATVVSGSTPKTKEEDNWNGGLNWITPAEINDYDFIIKNTQRTITTKGVQACSLKLLPVNTILLSSRAPIGKVAIVGKEMYCNQGFKNLICNNKINSYYMYFLLKNNSVYLNSLGRGATFKEISKNIVENIQIYVPPIELQNQFANFVNKVNDLKDKVNASLTSLTLLKKQQMQNYFG